MSGILRTYQVSACDNEMLTVECDSRTVVSIVVGYYGKPTPPRFTCRSHFVQRSNKLTNGSSPIVPPLPLVNHSSIDAVENNIITPSNHCPNVNHLRVCITNTNLSTLTFNIFDFTVFIFKKNWITMQGTESMLTVANSGIVGNSQRSMCTCDQICRTGLQVSA